MLSLRIKEYYGIFRSGLLHLCVVSFTMVFDLLKVLSLNGSLVDTEEKLVAAESEVMFVLIFCLSVDIDARICVEC